MFQASTEKDKSKDKEKKTKKKGKFAETFFLSLSLLDAYLTHFFQERQKRVMNLSQKKKKSPRRKRAKGRRKRYLKFSQMKHFIQAMLTSKGNRSLK